MTNSKCAELAMEGKEYHLFQKHRHDLCASISNNVKSFAYIAQEKGLISGADARRVMTDMLSSDYVKASELLSTLDLRIFDSRANYSKFLDILERMPTMSHFLDLLDPEQASRHINQTASWKTAAGKHFREDFEEDSQSHFLDLLDPEQASRHINQTASWKTAAGKHFREDFEEDSQAHGQASGQSDSQAHGQASGQAGSQAHGQASGKAGSPSKLKMKPSMGDAFLALLPIANEWKTIGTLLGLTPGLLDSIQNSFNNDRDRLREMVSEWLKTLDATWKALIEAVKNVNQARASEIEKEWCS